MHPFEAMADPARRRIVDILASGEHTAGVLGAVLGAELRISRTAVSKHLRVLRDAGIADVRADRNFRWWRLTTAGVEQLEFAVAELRQKTSSAIGWDAENRRKYDPLAGFQPSVLRRGPGRPHQRARRGRQRDVPPAADPDTGLYPVVTPPDADGSDPWLLADDEPNILD